jgi:hypothetical protein
VVDVDEEAHELGNTDRRVSVIELDGNLNDEGAGDKKFVSKSEGKARYKERANLMRTGYRNDALESPHPSTFWRGYQTQYF